MKKVKLLLVLEATVGGAYKHVMLLVKYLPREKFDISLILSPLRTNSFLSKDALKELNAACTYIPMEREVSFFKDISAIYKLYGYIKNGSFDVIHFHSSKAGFLGRVASFFSKQQHIIYTPHCFYFQGQVGIKRFFYKKLEQLMGVMTDVIITLSNSENELAKRENIIKGDKIKYVINALPKESLENDVYYKREVLNKYKVPDGVTVITGIGRLSKQKGWRVYIKIAEAVLKYRQDVVFLVVGDGEEYKGLIDSINNSHYLRCNLIFTGHVDCIEEIYLITDIVLNTSLWESTSYVLLEAMEKGIPIVATDIPGNNDIHVLKTQKLLYSANDYTEAVAIINRLFDDDHREEIGLAMYHYYDKINDFRNFVEIHESIYTTAIS